MADAMISLLLAGVLPFVLVAYVLRLFWVAGNDRD